MFYLDPFSIHRLLRPELQRIWDILFRCIHRRRRRRTNDSSDFAGSVRSCDLLDRTSVEVRQTRLAFRSSKNDFFQKSELRFDFRRSEWGPFDWQKPNSASGFWPEVRLETIGRWRTTLRCSEIRFLCCCRLLWQFCKNRQIGRWRFQLTISATSSFV